MDNLSKYQNIFMEIFGVEASALNANFAFEKIDIWDSMSHMVLIARLEDEFDVMFETQDILEYGSYENGIKILKRYGIDF